MLDSATMNRVKRERGQQERTKETKDQRWMFNGFYGMCEMNNGKLALGFLG